MRKLNFPLFWKFVIAIVTIVSIFGSINAYLIWYNLQQALEKESEKRATFIAKNLSNQLVNPLLYEDYVSAQKLIEEAIQLDDFLEYAFILDIDNKILLHTFPHNFPKNLLDVKINKNVNYTVTLLRDKYKEKSIIRDIAIPIFEANLGILRIGISEKSIFYDVRNTVLLFWLMATDKINLDAMANEKLFLVTVRGNSTSRLNFFFRTIDEIDKLTENFNDMILRLQTTFGELKQAQNKLVESEKMASIGTIAAGVAHEINNPISGIQNAIRRIIKNPDNIDQNMKYLSMMLDASERIENVVKELLNFSRREDLNKIEFDLLELLENIELLLSHKIDNLGIELFVEISKPQLIYASPNHIKQVLINLLLNSIDAIINNGINKKRIVISVKIDEGYSIIIVEDTGCGIPLDEIEKVFDPFYTSKSVNKGTGLGLSVSSQIINSHDGQLMVESIESVGTKFFIKLPVKK